MPRVRPNRIAHIGRYIRFNLATKKYTHDQWKNDLFEAEDSIISIKVMTERLQK
jgi:hypothetical protein